jgi:hypothetical protein
MSELVEKLKSETALTNLDGFDDSFDGYTDEAEGGEHDQDQLTSGRLIQGERISFSNEAVWVGVNGQPLPNNLQLLVHSVVRLVQKWGQDNMPAGPPLILAPNQKWPDIEAMNEACPKSEWRLRFGVLVGPYQAQKIVYLWDRISMNKYSWPTSSNSGMACVSELAEKIQMMRQFKKQKARPIVKLSSRLWSKRFNKQGPNFVVLQWVVVNEEGALVPLTDMAAITGPKPTTVKESLDQFAGMQPVSPPSGKEATDDSIQF